MPCHCVPSADKRAHGLLVRSIRFALSVRARVPPLSSSLFSLSGATVRFYLFVTGVAAARRRWRTTDARRGHVRRTGERWEINPLCAGDWGMGIEVAHGCRIYMCRERERCIVLVLDRGNVLLVIGLLLKGIAILSQCKETFFIFKVYQRSL